MSLIQYLLFLIPWVAALQVTPGSPCAQHCLDDTSLSPFLANSSSTLPEDIVCTDDSFDNSTVGVKFVECMTCLQKSDKVDGAESDLAWLLYNLRYTLGTCLYNSSLLASDQQIDSPCLTPSSCGRLEDTITGGNVTALVQTPTDSDDEYAFCDSGLLTGKWESACTSCFRTTTNQIYLANVVDTLKASCQQKPASGSLLSLSGDIFSTTALNLTSTDTTTSSSSDTEASSSTSSLNIPTIVGISVGGFLTLIGGLALFWVYFRRKKRPIVLPTTSVKARNPHPDTSATSSPTSPDQKGGIISSAASISSSLPPYTSPPHYMQHTRSVSAASIRSNGSYHTMTSADLAILAAQASQDGPPAPHPAYIPGRSSRTASPAPSSHSASNSIGSSASYATSSRKRTRPSPLGIELQQSPPSKYSQVDGVSTAGPAPQATSATMEAVRSGIQDGTFTIPPPPPPPSNMARPQVPTLSIPNSRNMRGRRFAPPAIVVHGASPIAEVDEGQAEALGVAR